ncbi:hypothetical protein [Actinacidiphila soli]|uniref:hypothetical protein n=1 Tax=Actinacidiphila soli TaxID=2487275 RepID=UPI000FCBE6DD|nr:hypothetical protein [Actinacidiphila soli]
MVQTTSNFLGACGAPGLDKVDQNGGTSCPRKDGGWAEEISRDGGLLGVAWRAVAEGVALGAGWLGDAGVAGDVEWSPAVRVKPAQ